MEAIRIGQRVRVIAAHLANYSQVGIVTAHHANEGYYVHLDYDDDLPDGSIFFHCEELEAAPEALPRPPQPASWAADDAEDRRPERADAGSHTRPRGTAEQG